MSLSAAARRFTLTTHVTTSAGWVGAVLVFIALAILGLTSDDGRVVRGAYLVMAPAAWFVLVPLAHASLVSGLVLSLGSAWGLLRHYWVALKLVITAVCTAVLLAYMGTFRQMAAVAADPVVDLGLVRNPSPLVHGCLALLLLLVATALAIYKPFGPTPFGAHERATERAPAQSDPMSTVRSTPAWLYVAAAAGGLGVLLLLLHHLAGAQMRH